MTEVGEPIKRPIWAIILRAAGILVIVATNIYLIGTVLDVGVNITGVLLVVLFLAVSVQNLILSPRRGRNGSSRRRSQVHRPDETVNNRPYILLLVLSLLGGPCFIYGALRIGPFADQFVLAGLALFTSSVVLSTVLTSRLRRQMPKEIKDLAFGGRVSASATLNKKGVRQLTIGILVTGLALIGIGLLFPGDLAPVAILTGVTLLLSAAWSVYRFRLLRP